MLELDDVCFERDGRPYIYPTKLELERGSLNVLLGPTLAGKTHSHVYDMAVFSEQKASPDISPDCHSIFPIA